MAKTSRYEKTLRELGFKPIGELSSQEDIAEVENAVELLMGLPVPSKLSRAQRRQLVAKGVLPAFCCLNGSTQAFDELGGEWWAHAEVDLKSFGFCDYKERLATTAKKRKSTMH